MSSRWVAVRPQACLVIEDSPSGVKAALAARMWRITVTTPLTRAALHKQQVLPSRHVVDDPRQLLAAVSHIMETHSDHD